MALKSMERLNKLKNTIYSEILKYGYYPNIGYFDLTVGARYIIGILRSHASALKEIIEIVNKRTNGSFGIFFIQPTNAIDAVQKLADVCDGMIDRSVSEIRNDKITVVRKYALYLMNDLISVNFPNVTVVETYGIRECRKLRSVHLPKVERIDSYAFMYNASLTVLDFPRLSEINSYRAFGQCPLLKTFILRNNKACTLGEVSSFSGTPIESGTGYIYVPRSLVDSYKTATNWTVYASQFRALEDYTVDGTTTGALDESKI